MNTMTITTTIEPAMIWMQFLALGAHFVGDYVLQSHWMALNKGRSSLVALVHVIFYTIPFAFITQEPIALFLILSTHFVIDRFQISRYVCVLHNYIAPWRYRPSFTDVENFGFPKDVSTFVAFWLMVIIDNIMHLFINALIIYHFS